MTATALEKFLTLQDASRRIGVSYQGIYSMITRGDLPAQRWGSRWIVSKADVVRIQRQRKRREWTKKSKNANGSHPNRTALRTDKKNAAGCRRRRGETT